MLSISFNDLAGLQALVSEDFGPYGERLRIDQSMIDQFAELTRDRQWIHVDAERAATESPFKTTIAHGFLVLSLITVLSERVAGASAEPQIVGHGSVINYGAERLRFVSPVPAGSEVHARRRIVHVRKKGPGGTQLTFDTEVRVVGAERPAVTYRSLVLFLPPAD